jgi:hypothetical protein
MYAGLPGVRVEPLHFASWNISGERLLSMMKVDETASMYITLLLNLFLLIMIHRNIFVLGN